MSDTPRKQRAPWREMILPLSPEALASLAQARAKEEKAQEVAKSAYAAYEAARGSARRTSKGAIRATDRKKIDLLLHVYEVERNTHTALSWERYELGKAADAGLREVLEAAERALAEPSTSEPGARRALVVSEDGLLGGVLHVPRAIPAELGGARVALSPHPPHKLLGGGTVGYLRAAILAHNRTEGEESRRTPIHVVYTGEDGYWREETGMLWLEEALPPAKPLPTARPKLSHVIPQALGDTRTGLILAARYVRQTLAHARIAADHTAVALALQSRAGDAARSPPAVVSVGRIYALVGNGEHRRTLYAVTPSAQEGAPWHHAAAPVRVTFVPGEGGTLRWKNAVRTYPPLDAYAGGAWETPYGDILIELEDDINDAGEGTTPQGETCPKQP